MTRSWIQEESPRWDVDKERIVGGVAPGVFNLGGMRIQEIVPGEWWRVEEDGVVVGYGWVDVVWGEGEVFLAVDPKHRGTGVGVFIIDHLVVEAQKRGIRWLHNIVRATHPRKKWVTSWLVARGFEPTVDDGSLRLRVPAGP